MWISRRRLIGRRSFLQGVTAAGVVVATAPLLGCGDGTAISIPIGGSSTVYRFQTLKSDRCTACRNHQHYKVFLDAATADASRAHAGCNCRIVAQRVTLQYLEGLSPYVVGGAVDLRAVYL
jgi:hypothetical protein